MAREWREMGRAYFPDAEFATAWDLYQHAARLIIDRAFIISVMPADATAPPGIVSMYLADMVTEAEDGAVAAAKAHLTLCLGASAFLSDIKRYGDGLALTELLEETQMGDE